MGAYISTAISQRMSTVNVNPYVITNYTSNAIDSGPTVDVEESFEKLPYLRKAMIRPLN
jgi:hypothetical protein